MDKKDLLDQLHQLPLQERMDIVDSLLEGMAFESRLRPSPPSRCGN